jgi:hypothetical protein
MKSASALEIYKLYIYSNILERGTLNGGLSSQLAYVAHLRSRRHREILYRSLWLTPM